MIVVYSYNNEADTALVGGGESVMLWGCFTALEPGQLTKVQGNSWDKLEVQLERIQLMTMFTTMT